MRVHLRGVETPDLAALAGASGIPRHDPDHAADADGGGHRAGRFSPRDRRLGPVVQRRAPTRSVQRLGVRVSQSVGDGVEDTWFTTAKVFGFATSGCPAASSAGGRPARRRRPRRWRPISCRFFSRRAILRPRKPRRRGVGRAGGLTQPFCGCRSFAPSLGITSNCSCVFPEPVVLLCPRKTDIGIGSAHIEFLRCFARAWRFSPAAVAGIIMPTKPTIIEMDMGKLEDVLRRAEARN